MALGIPSCTMFNSVPQDTCFKDTVVCISPGKFGSFGHRIGLKERPIDSFRCRAQHTVKLDGVCGHGLGLSKGCVRWVGFEDYRDKAAEGGVCPILGLPPR